ncbi:thioredoxin fold domain-containing protein [Flavobacterium paronense]|uniref:Thioredoxin family protein n=1 Tax=Flavobacterium paronense TaxID=1392775 RepID=A0ABV5GBE8_9FLAO|nr:thioredoxin fold domain-containing protein [Flavobacterium paronense]MDN3677331.1 thioredoxin fold domain-containing protein [Flavobacterium paronense]
MIKKFILILFLILNTALAVGQKQTLFLDKNYTETLTKSKVEKKPIVILFYATWCVHCNKMKNEVFTDSIVTQFYRTNFILMAVDATSSYGQELRTKFQNKFKVSSFPTFVFMDSDESLLYCITGELTKDAFLSEGKDVLLPENQLPNILKTYNEDPSNQDKCLKYITTIRKAGMDATPIAQKYFSTKTQEERFTELNWRIFSNGINNFDTDEFKFVVKNKDSFSKVASPSRVDKKISYTISETLKPLVELGDTINYNKKRLIAKSFQIRKIDSLLYRFDIQLALQTGNLKKYKIITTENVQNFSWNDAVLLYDICNTYLETINDKKGLLQALEWSKHLISLGESIDKYVLTTKLSLKVKDHKQALLFAQKGKLLADSLGFKNDEINSLLAEAKRH